MKISDFYLIYKYIYIYFVLIFFSIANSSIKKNRTVCSKNNTSIEDYYTHLGNA